MNRIRKAQSLFGKLSQAEKVVTIGALLTMISVALPWYRDMDAWGKGEMFLGITGPLSLVGLIILVASGAVFLQMVGRMRGQEFKFLKKYDNLAMIMAAENILLFIIASSVYLDPHFGVNLTLKETTFGIFLCLIGSVIMGLGGYMKKREPEKPELNVFEQVQDNIEQIHKDIAREKGEFRREEDVPLAEQQYREMHSEEASEKSETIKMDL